MRPPPQPLDRHFPAVDGDGGAGMPRRLESPESLLVRPRGSCYTAQPVSRFGRHGTVWNGWPEGTVQGRTGG